MTSTRLTLLEELFGVEKPVIAMVHFLPLPGTPLYDEERGVAGIVESMAEDIEKLLAGGVDSVLLWRPACRSGRWPGRPGCGVLAKKKCANCTSTTRLCAGWRDQKM